MKKQEALNYIREKVGYVPYIMFFEIYDDEDEIPEGVIKLSCNPPKSNTNTIICGSQVAKAIEDALNN